MIVKFELVSAISKDRDKPLGRIVIGNQGVSANERRGDYEAEIYKKTIRGAPWKVVEIEDFPRLSLHPWNLVRKILNEAAVQNGGRI